MNMDFRNLVFSGGGVLGIAYLGLLDSLYQRNLMDGITRVAGTSAGAITACLTSFNLPFAELKDMVNSLDYTNIPAKDSASAPRLASPSLNAEFERLFDNFDCVSRLLKQFGWYSSNYFYNWIKAQIATQFDENLKLPPYTFADFKDAELHKDKRPFKDLYMIGTNVSHATSSVFSYDSTPNMEVAEAVRISMSIPLFFESITSTCEAASPRTDPRIYSDGGLLYTYPINLFDEDDLLIHTLGSLIKSDCPPSPINNIVDFIASIISCATSIQYNIYKSNPTYLARTIEINTGQISTMDFNIKIGDPTYTYLYTQGYTAAETFLENYLQK